MKKLLVGLLILLTFSTAYGLVKDPLQIPFSLVPNPMQGGQSADISPSLMSPVVYSIQCQLSTSQNNDPLYLFVNSGNSVKNIKLNGARAQTAPNEVFIKDKGNYILTFTVGPQSSSYTPQGNYNLVFSNQSMDNISITKCMATAE